MRHAIDMPATLRVFVVLALTLAVPTVSLAQSPSRKNHDEFASATTIQALAVSAKHGGRFDDSMVGETLWNAATLGIDALALSPSQRSARYLADLVSFKLDGAISEAYTCAVLHKGAPMVPLLLQLKSGSETPCRKYAKSTDSGPDAVCAASADLKRHVDSLVASIKGKKQCGTP